MVDLLPIEMDTVTEVVEEVEGGVGGETTRSTMARQAVE